MTYKPMKFGGLKLTRTGHFNFEDTPEEKWLVEDVLPTAATGMIVAPPKTGKTWLLLDLAISVASGVPFLGRFNVPCQGDVIIRSPEGGAKALEERIELVCAFKKLNRLSVPIHVLTARRFHLDDPIDQKEIEQAVKAVKPLLLLFDPLRKCFGGQENNNEHINRATSFISYLSNAYDVSVMIAHHTSKASDGQGGASIRGGGDWFGFGDTYLILDTNKYGHQTLSFIQRQVEELKPINVKRVKKFGGLSYVATGKPRIKKELDPVDKIIKFFVDNPTGRHTTEVIRPAVKLKYKTVSSTLKLLASDGKIFRHPSGGYCAKKPRIPKTKKPTHPKETLSRAGGLESKGQTNVIL